MTKEKQTRDEDRLQDEAGQQTGERGRKGLPEEAAHAGPGSLLSKSGRECHIIVSPLSENI